MILKTKNVGKLYKEAKIKLNGITVLVGENGTGKSTLGKVLYCVFNTLFDYDSKIQDEKERSVLRKLSRYNRGGFSRNIYNRKIIEGFFDIDFSNDEEIRKALSGLYGRQNGESEIPDVLINEIKSIVSTPDDDIVNVLLRRRFESEFALQIGHVDYPNDNSSITLEIKGNFIEVDVNREGVRFNNKIKLIKDLVYIDDPYVIDELEDMHFGYASGPGHRIDLMRKLRGQKEDMMTAVDDVIVMNKLEEINSILDSVCDGVITEGEDDSVQYMDGKLKKGISTVNVSTGMKGFVILKTLLKSGFLEENGMVVLDEPETHLHPEWMLKYAEIVVLLHNVLNINFLISTHSSEFLSFIQSFIIKHNCSKSCNYYMLKNDPEDDTKSIVQEYSGDQLDEIYDVLTRPFITVSKELDEING